ncbi:transcriptional regulator swi6 [Exophiala xenobiotica]|nr:transcriptional regulator swi6 [Exophiala xenobiotica]KAK5295906.1 transcriptional regulator swi6 [Exophiala xenobiotica]KAK5372439.1 transcriptional regulator swi6 [Exophiala xenobiotica]KAK5393880.1 transcriptional regulator swi6 [Exophiala xenobiotica]KAK5415058.1 transcriptional regulator swi6 [Exophiala xenobiotica]
MPPYSAIKDDWSDYDDESDVEIYEPEQKRVVPSFPAEDYLDGTPDEHRPDHDVEDKVRQPMDESLEQASSDESVDLVGQRRWGPGRVIWYESVANPDPDPEWRSYVEEQRELAGIDLALQREQDRLREEEAYEEYIAQERLDKQEEQEEREARKQEQRERDERLDLWYARLPPEHEDDGSQHSLQSKPQDGLPAKTEEWIELSGSDEETPNVQDIDRNLVSSAKGLSQSYDGKVYSITRRNVPVLEIRVRGTKVMRRKEDSWLNAGQILRVAGLTDHDRMKAIRALRAAIPGEFETINGGNPLYQGTWVPYESGRELARQFGVEQILLPLLEYEYGSYAVGEAGQPSRKGSANDGRDSGGKQRRQKDVFDQQTTEDGKEQAPNLRVVKASQYEWSSSSDSDSEDVLTAADPVRVHSKSSIPILVSDIPHPTQPRTDMNSKRKRHSEPLYPSGSRSPKKPKRIRSKPTPSQSPKTTTPMPDYTQFSARSISRTIRDAVSYLDVSDVNSRLRYDGAGGTFNSNLNPSRGKDDQTELSKWFDRRDAADYMGVHRAVAKAKAKIPMYQLSPQIAHQTKMIERRKVLDQRFVEGKSSGYFMSQLIDLANQSGVSDRAILGLLLQDRAARDIVLNVFANTVDVDDSGNLSVSNDRTAGNLEADLHDAKEWDFDHDGPF